MIQLFSIIADVITCPALVEVYAALIGMTIIYLALAFWDGGNIE